MMTTTQFFIVWGLCLLTMLASRVLPIFILQGRQLSEGLTAALELIPPAAFAALVANDLFSPDMFDDGLVIGIIPLLAAAIVVVVARRTRSLIICAVVGVIAYWLFTILL